MLNRRTLVVLALSFLTVWAFQYFTRKDQPSQPGGADADGKVQTGQFYTAPVKQTWHREPKREIDFIDTKITPDQEQNLTVQTPKASVTFSNFGAVIQSISFKNHKSKSGGFLQTISSDTVEQQEEGCFLMALDEKTPYLYQFVSKTEHDDAHEVVYQAKIKDWVIRKTYVLYNDSYKIDIKLDFETNKSDAQPLNPRLFYPAPQVFEVKDNDVTGFMTKDGVRIETISKHNELGGVWGLPEIFGAQDKYFAHTLIKDPGRFAQGGYFKRVNRKLFSIVEGAQINASKSIALSFYVGPKLLSDLTAVDERLEDLLSFGWLSWFCKILLRLLEFLHKHIQNFGLAIIVLTILLKLPFVPLSISSRRKMEEYQKYQPTINRIRAKYRTDVAKQQEEVLRFHKEHNLSPTTPMVGCLPLLIQLPILFSLYRVLGNYLSLYQAPFVGWLQDLSAPDPYYVLPILMGATMFLQQTMSPIADEKQRMMMMFMPIVMTAIFINFPSGLVLYWLVNNVLTIGEDLLRKKLFS